MIVLYSCVVKNTMNVLYSKHSKILWFHCTVVWSKYYDFIVQLCGQKYYDCIVQFIFKNTVILLYSCVVKNTMIVVYRKPSKILWFNCTVAWSKIPWLDCTVDIQKYYDCIVQLCGQKFNVKCWINSFVLNIFV